MQNSIFYHKHSKPEMMPGIRPKQLQYESETWKRLLGFMLEENVHLKNRLSEILKNGFNRNFLEEIENFQTRIIKEDERIGLLRHEVVELDKLMAGKTFGDGQISEEINTRIKNLQNSINNAENEFARLKTDFNSYLFANF